MIIDVGDSNAKYFRLIGAESHYFRFTFIIYHSRGQRPKTPPQIFSDRVPEQPRPPFNLTDRDLPPKKTATDYAQ